MNMNDQSLLQRTLQKYPHLDLSHHILTEIAVPKGGGGCSDVFQSKLTSTWRPRSDPNIMKLLKLKVDPLNSLPEQGEPGMVESSLDGASMESSGITVAVKRLRFWSKPHYRIEKVVLVITTP